LSAPARWQGVPDAVHRPPGLLWPVVLVRALLILLITGVLLPVFLLLRLSDTLWPGRYRAHLVVHVWSGLLLALFGVRVRLHGARLAGHGAIVANHSSWLDILTLHQVARIRFVAKAEVRRWPLIGYLARISDTAFIERRRSESRTQQDMVRERLHGSQTLCIFPEGTSSDGLRVLPFKSTIFAALHEFGEQGDFVIQPVSLIYRPQSGLRPDFYGWWGRMKLFTHAGSVLARSWSGAIDIVLHEPLNVRDFPDRKVLARHCEDLVREGHRLFSAVPPETP
jgi:lyso-ornithine lipid O-acyltransferase